MANKHEERDHIIKLAAEIGAKTALKAFDEEISRAKNERVDRRLRNTKLLLRNYRMFKAHAENAVYDAQDLDESAYDIIDLMSDRWQDSEVFVESIKQSVARTVTIVAHVDTMLGLYESYCVNSGNQEEVRRWEVIKALYIDEPAAGVRQLARQFNVTERTIYRDIDIACERIAALIFGIDGVKKG